VVGCGDATVLLAVDDWFDSVNVNLNLFVQHLNPQAARYLYSL